MNNFNCIINVDKDFLYSLENDHGYSEVFQYIKEFWIFLLLFFIAVKRKHVIYLIWSLLFLYLLLDDSISIHEHLGEFFANYFNLHSEHNLRAVDFGELLVSFGVGCIFIAIISLLYHKGPAEVKKASIQIFTLLLFLVFFGIFIDMAHTFFDDDWKLGLIEDGGEMIAMSLIAAYIFNLYNKSEKRLNSTFNGLP